MIKIVKLNNGFKVEGIDNVLYPDNGTLVFGANTVILVTDESNMATFRSASNFDVLFSGLIENITIDGESVTKDNIVEKFQAVANVTQGSQEDVSHRLEQIESEVALKANSADLLTLFDSAEYNSQTKKIVFKHGDTVLVQIDATDFIKDGMVSNVEIVNDKLVISFNTDSGKENIEITLSDIFNPNNYYTKQEIDTKEQNINASIALKVDQETFDTKEEVISKALNDLHDSIPTVPTNVSAFTNDAGYLTQDEVNVSEVVQKTDANDNYMSNTFVTTSNKVVTVGNAMSDSSKTHTFGYDKTYTVTEEQTFAKPFNQAKIQDWIDAGFVTTENITLGYTGEGTGQPIPSYRLKVNIPSDIQARLVAKEKMTLAEMRFIKKSDDTELVVPVGNFSCDGLTNGNVYWFKNGVGYGGDETPKVEEIETQYGFCVQFEGQYTGSTINHLEVNNGCMSAISSKTAKNIQILFDGNIWKNETFRLYNESLNSHDEYSFVDFKFVGEMADTITETIINTKVNNYDEHPEKLNEYIRFANDVKAKILTDKNIDEVVDIEAKQDKLVSGTNIKTINGNSILGEGNIVIQGGGGEQQQADWNQTDSTAVDYIKNKPTIPDMTNYYTKQEIDNKFSEVETTLSQI